MPENKLFTIPLAAFVPPEELLYWHKTQPPFIAVHDTPRLSARDIVARLEDAESEYSGAIGPDWFTLTKGTGFAAPLDVQSLFTWHFHPDDSLTLSPEDWVAFLASSASVSALFTGTAAMIVQKTPLTKAAQSAVRQCLCENAETPNLALLRVFALLAKYGCRLDAMTDADIGRALHMRCIIGDDAACS